MSPAEILIGGWATICFFMGYYLGWQQRKEVEAQKRGQP